MSSTNSAHSARSLILIPGGWHTAFHLGPLIAAFKRDHNAELVVLRPGELNESIIQSLLSWDAALNRGTQSIFTPLRGAAPSYRLVPCPLYAAGPKPERPAKFKDDVDVILNAIRSEAALTSNEICVVAHSAAGIAALEAVNRFFTTASEDQKSRLTHLIFVAAILGGRNNATQVPEEQGWVRYDPQTDLMHVSRAEEFFFSDLSPEIARLYAHALVPHVKGEAAPAGELFTGEAWRRVPCKVYLIADNDNCVPVRVQEIEAKAHGMTLDHRLQSDHCPFVSQPDEFMKVLLGFLSSDSNGI